MGDFLYFILHISYFNYAITVRQDVGGGATGAT